MTAFGSAGRWGGRLTGRALPDSDADIDALDDAQRAELTLVWLGRTASERRVADAFEVVRDALVELHAPDDVVKLATRAVDDEYRHEELSRRVASRFAGRDLEPPPRLTLVVPEHPGADGALLHTLHVLGHCAMNETFASVFLETSLAFAKAPLARAAVQELLSDEIDHARLGWAHLGGLDSKRRAEVAPWLLPMIRANLKMWRDTPRPYSTDPAIHRQGAPPADAVETALRGAITDLMIPGLERLGLPTVELRGWVSAGAKTS
ncbi:MAG TPA: hypothetical protein VFZ53_23845 [Polyangiaceae bacterium]